MVVEGAKYWSLAGGMVNITIAFEEVTLNEPAFVEVEKVKAFPVAVPPPAAMVVVATPEVR